MSLPMSAPLRRQCAASQPNTCFRRLLRTAAAAETSASAQATAPTATPKRTKIHPSERNPFLPYKAPSGRWWPPQYSLRRQAQVVEAGLQLGTLEALPEGPKKARMLARLQGSYLQAQQEQILQEDALSAAFNGWKLSADEDQKIAKAVVRTLKQQGPYSGRKIMFKGTLAARTRNTRHAKIAAKVQAMPDTVAAWKKVRSSLTGLCWRSC